MKLLGNRDPKREWEQQAAFEQAEQERAERRAAATFESFVDACPVAVEMFSPDGTLQRSNRAAERLLGKIPPPGLSLLDARGLKRTGLLEPQLKRVLAGSRVETPPTWYNPTDIGLPGVTGGGICFRATVLPLFDSENRVVRIAVVYEDVTAGQTRTPEPREPDPVRPASAEPAPGGDIRDLEFRRRKLEQSLRESEERFRAFVENASGYVMLRFTEQGRMTAVSPSIRELWGISADAVLTDPSAFFTQVVPEDLARVRDADTRIRETGVWPDEFRFRVRNRQTNSIRWVEMRGSTATVLGRRVFDAIALDITSLLELEQRCVKAEASLNSVVASTLDGIVTLDAELKVLTWSPAAEAATALQSGDAVGRPLTELYPDFEKTGFLPAIRRTLREQKAERHEAFCHDGREQYAGWYGIACYPFGTGVLLIVRNLTDQRKTELAHRTCEARLDALLASPELFVTLKDKQLHYRLANEAALRSLGLDGNTPFEGKTDRKLLKRRVADLLTSHDRQALTGSDPVELELALPDAVSENSAWYRLVKTAFRDPDGEVMGVLTVGWDISRQVHALQELARRRAWLDKLVAQHGKLIENAGSELERWQG